MKNLSEILAKLHHAKHLAVFFEQDGYYTIFAHSCHEHDKCFCGMKLLLQTKSADEARAFYVKARDQGVYK